MKDRFKYRAWDKENKKYIYDVEKGLQFYSTAGNLRVLTLAEVAESSKYDLEQCTGLTDKNNKLIYEGDIVKYHVIKKSSFPIEREVLAFKTKKVTFKKGYFSPVFNLDLNDVEIIGNIHEDSELLENNNVKHSE